MKISQDPAKDNILLKSENVQLLNIQKVSRNIILNILDAKNSMKLDISLDNEVFGKEKKIAIKIK